MARVNGPVEEERGPGRPEVGGPVHVRLGDDLLRAVDAYAKAEGNIARAEAIRRLVTLGLEAPRPETEDDIARWRAARTKALRFARELVDDGTDIRALAHYVIDDLHKTFPFLEQLKSRAQASFEIDWHRTGGPNAISGLDVEDSPETRLAQAAYDAALRSVILGYDPAELQR